MRLLNTTTLLLESFGREVPPYAILSHRWLDNELLFESAQQESWQTTITTQGAIKTRQACQQALKDGLDYLWVDTCCIDKSSSTELSEAINSMFRYYNGASVCYAYLVDVGEEEGSFEQSVWFKRGWTLQELIAPEALTFYDCRWNRLGDRKDLAPIISEITGIHEEVLSRGEVITVSSCDRMKFQREKDAQLRIILSSYSVAARLSWAAGRLTTRKEDTAYSLLGLFDINIPLLYGEGEQAFPRFLQEVVRRTGDPSVLLSTGCVAPFYHSPQSYAGRGNVVWLEAAEPAAATVSIAKSGALAIEAQVAPCNVFDRRTSPHRLQEAEFVAVVLDCVLRGSHSRLALILRRCYVHNIYEQWRELPFIELDPRQRETIASIPGQHRFYSVNFMESYLENLRLEVAFTETYRVTQRKSELLVDPLIQPSNMHFELRKSWLVTNLPEDGNEIGVFVIEDRVSNGFLLLWGYKGSNELTPSANRRLSQDIRRATQPKLWCRVLSWKDPMLGIPKTDVPIMEKADIHVLSRDPVELWSGSDQGHLRSVINLFRSRCDSKGFVDLGDIVVKVSLRPLKFLNITSYRLVIEILPGTNKLDTNLRNTDIHTQSVGSNTPTSSASGSTEENHHSKWSKFKTRSGF